jgi:hypothetical protein
VLAIPDTFESHQNVLGLMKTFTHLLIAATLCTSPGIVEAQYCMLPGRTAYASEQPGITNFKVNTINRESLNLESPLSAPPIVVAGDSTTLVRGKTYKVSITHTRDAVNFPNARNNIRVWLDYNGNFSFTDNKETVISKDFQPYGTFIDSFTVPVDAPLGTIRLRVTAKMSSDAGHTIPTSCDDPKDPLGYHGEMEDYKVIIASPTAISNISGTAPGISVYPMPVTTSMTIAFNSKPLQPVSAILIDVTGKQVATLLNNKKIDSDKTTIDLSALQLAQGVYFVKVSTEGATYLHRIVKID